MRILLAHNSPYYPAFGGGDKSNRLLMESLAARGHSVLVAARVDRFGADSEEHLLAELRTRGIPAVRDAAGVRFRRNGVEVQVLTLQPHVRPWFASQIAAFDPDVILTSTDDPAHLMLEPALRSPRARVVYLVRATVALPFGPDTSFASEWKTGILRQADGVVAVSEYVAQYARRWGGLEAVHVPISLLEPGEFPYSGRFDNRFVTMVNPCAVKGISIFLALARRFPETDFAAVPTWGTTAADLAALYELPNVSVLAPVDQIDDILRETRVVLVPSLWAEARSRMILEAMARGIPVMASQVGGLGEAMLGMDYLVPVQPVAHYHSVVDELMVPAAAIPAQDIGPWETILGRLLTDRAHYERLSAASRERALAYAAGLTCLPFEAYLEQMGAAPRRRETAAAPAGPKAVAPAAKPPLSPEKQRLMALRLRRKLGPEKPEKKAPAWLSEAEVRDLDTPAGRPELARRATQLARAALPGADIEILWDGLWIRRVGAVWFPDPELFRAAEPNWQRWAGLADKFLRDAADYWFHVYKPCAGDVIVDVGAGRGEDVFAFARAAGPSGRVWAIEPHPVSFQALEKFCALNGLANVTTLHYACTDAPAHLQIETLPVWESNYVRPGEPGAASYPVEGLPLDTLLAGHGVERIDFLKMNIEGAERMALPGCRAMLARTRFACIAAHDFRAARGEGEHFKTLEFVKHFLREAGFSILTRDTDPRYYVPYHVHGFRERTDLK